MVTWHTDAGPRSPSANAAIDFPGRSRDETVHFYFRQHWIRLVRPLGRLMLWTAVLSIAFAFALPIISARGSTGHLLLVLLAGLFLYAQCEFLATFYRHFLYVLIITNRKIHRIKKTLFIFDDHQSIDISALQDVRKSQRGIFQNMLGFGTLTFEAQETVLQIHFVPAIQHKYNAILHIRGWETPTPHHAPPPVVTAGNS